jgi:hypothetical protein
VRAALWVKAVLFMLNQNKMSKSGYRGTVEIYHVKGDLESDKRTFRHKSTAKKCLKAKLRKK